jgi:hypothetical protein
VWGVSYEMILKVASHVGKVVQGLNPHLFQLIPITLNILYEFLDTSRAKVKKLFPSKKKQFYFEKYRREAFRDSD